MDKHLQKPTVRRIILGLLLIALAVALGILLGDTHLGPETSMQQRMTFIVCVFGLGLGGFLFLFLGWRGFLLGIGFVLVIALPRALPDPWNRYFAFVYLAALLGLRPLLNWLKKRKKTSNKPAVPRKKDRRTMLKQVRMGLMIAICAIALPWLFLDVPYKLFSVLSLLPFPIILTLVCLFPDEITMDEKMVEKTGGNVEFVMPWMASVFAPALRTLSDFNFLTWKPLLILSVLLLVVIAVLLLVFREDLRRRIGYLLCILLITSFFCFGAIGQVNYLVDTSEATRQDAVITDMHISTSSKGPDRYILTVITDSGEEMDLMVAKEEYQALSVGGSVTVSIKNGGLGIPYAGAGRMEE